MSNDLFEQLAAIQHDIWASWQEYVQNTKMNGDRSISKSDFDHWQRQINTPYAELTDKEQESDREQVHKFWHLIKPMQERVKELEEKLDLYKKLQAAPSNRPYL